MKRRTALGWVAGLGAGGWSLWAKAVGGRGDTGVEQLLRALGPNEAVALGRAEVVGPFNEVARRYGLDRTGPRSRDYTLKMVWSPQRQRALFTGANHGAPHRLNDVWEFDLAALRWTLLYSPDNSRDYAGLGDDASDVVFRDGILQTRRGGPAIIGHGWSGQTYDPWRQQMLFMNTWVTKQDAAVRRVGGDPLQRYRGAPLWAFDPATARWMPIKTGGPSPAAPFGAMLEFVPELGGAIWHTNGWESRSTWLFDSARQSWRDLKANVESKDFARQSPQREAVAYHDAKRRLVIAQSGRHTHHFDTTRLHWQRVADADESPSSAPFAHDARTAAHHDPVSGHGLLIDFKERRIWSYDPEITRWSVLQPEGSPMPDGKRMLAFMDLARNVFVVIDDTAVWAYRYRARA